MIRVLKSRLLEYGSSSTVVSVKLGQERQTSHHEKYFQKFQYHNKHSQRQSEDNVISGNLFTEEDLNTLSSVEMHLFSFFFSPLTYNHTTSSQLYYK